MSIDLSKAGAWPRRLRFFASAERPVVASDRANARVQDVLILGLGVGLLAGSFEILALAIRDVVDLRVAVADLRMNRHWPWMVPLSDLVLFAAIGPFVAMLAPRIGRRGVLFAYLMLASLPVFLAIRGLHLAAASLLAVGFGARISGTLVGRWDGIVHATRQLGPVFACGLAMFGIAAFHVVDGAEARGLAALPPAPVGAPNLLWIVLDTVRADALGVYGYGRDTSPNLAKLADRGVRFAQARSTAPWTLPSHASMFTGRWPHELSVGVERRLDAAHPTIAEALAARGYLTGGFVANTHFCNARYGLDRGFLRYEDHPQNVVISPGEVLRNSAFGRLATGGLARLGVEVVAGAGDKDAATVHRDALGWIDEARAAGRPFFVFVNDFDAHHPYVPPAGASRRFGLIPETPADRRVVERFFDVPKGGYDDRQYALARDGYDDCIAYLDEQVGRLLGELDRRGVLDNTVVVVTSDHGESWGEHQLFGHGRSLYRPEVHVPLIVAGPKDVPRDRVIDEPVSLRDLPATALDLLGLESPGSFPGGSLARFWRDDEPETGPILSEVAIVENRDLSSRVPALQGPMASLLEGGRQFIRNASGREELYDLDDDDEDHNLTALPESREPLKQLRQRLKQFTRP